MAEHRARHEATDVGLRLAWIGLPLLLGSIIALLLLTAWLYPLKSSDRSLQLPLLAFPDPQLQLDSAQDLSRERSRELSQLNGSGWVDRSAGVVHIPIERAMRELAQRGLPDWPAPAAPVSSP